MKVYVLMSYKTVEYEEVNNVIGVFSSESKAKAAVRKLKKVHKNSMCPAEYEYFECELDEIDEWELVPDEEEEEE